MIESKTKKPFCQTRITCITFSKHDRVHKDGKIGTVTRVSDKAVHVKYDDDYFEKFHFNPTHHMQTSITALKHYT